MSDNAKALSEFKDLIDLLDEKGCFIQGFNKQTLVDLFKKNLEPVARYRMGMSTIAGALTMSDGNACFHRCDCGEFVLYNDVKELINDNI